MVRTRSQPFILNLPERLALQVTPAQFAALAAANRELRLERTATGELIVNPPTGSETGYRNWNLSGELYLWWRNAGEPGKAFDSSSGFELPNGANRSPDASWVSQERWDALMPEQRKGFAPFVLILWWNYVLRGMHSKIFKPRWQNISGTGLSWDGSLTLKTNEWKFTVPVKRLKF